MNAHQEPAGIQLSAKPKVTMLSVWVNNLRKHYLLYLMFLPAAFFFIIVKYVPMVGIVIAFKDYNFVDGLWGSPWVGLSNFELLFSHPQSLQIIRNTLILSITAILISFPFPIILAILLNEVRSMRFKRWAQTLIYLPYFFSWVVVGGIIVTIFSIETGFANQVMEAITGRRYEFLYNEGSWIAIFLASGIWKEAGYGAIIYLAALGSVDMHLYEAANLDGANKWRQIWHVTLPGLRLTIVIMLILGMGSAIDLGFDRFYSLQNPVVSNVAEVMSTYVYKMGIVQGEFSFSATMGLFESIVAFIMIVGTNAIARKFDNALW